MGLGLTFLGGAQTVTGSKFLLEVEGRYILVDCGLFQGIKELRIQNWQDLPIKPAAIDAVILTHAHLDHSGYLPLLVKKGFKGKIFCTAPTRAISELILLDAARINEEETFLALQGGYSKHAHPRALFDTRDVERCLPHFSTEPRGQWREILPHCRFRLVHSGHILGSVFVEIDYRGTRVVFSGDLGRQKPLLLDPPQSIARADYLILESTYGDRLHPKEPVQRLLARIIQETLERGGDLIVPSFAVGRTQDLLWIFSELQRRKQIPNVPIYLDSPMGVQATEIFFRFPDWHRASPGTVKAMEKTAIMVSDSRISKSVLGNKKRKIIIAGSGMVTGGRILEHLKKALPHERNTVLLVGYQAVGTRGRQIKDRVPEIKVHGEYITNRAHVEEVSSLSAHADQAETLKWLKGFSKAPQETFLVHGEPQSSDVLRLKIKDTLGWDCKIPKQFETVSLDVKRKSR